VTVGSWSTRTVDSVTVRLPFAGHDDAGLDLPELDHVRDRQHAGEETEARVADVEVQTVRLEPEVAVHEARDGRLDEVLADRRADEHVDAPAVDLRFASARSAARVATSLGCTPGSQNRRARIPVMASRNPGAIPRRR
jgi:hypothetical protein